MEYIDITVDKDFDIHLEEDTTRIRVFAYSIDEFRPPLCQTVIFKNKMKISDFKKMLHKLADSL